MYWVFSLTIAKSSNRNSRVSFHSLLSRGEIPVCNVLHKFRESGRRNFINLNNTIQEAQTKGTGMTVGNIAYFPALTFTMVVLLFEFTSKAWI
jgi:hypothetical protein